MSWQDIIKRQTYRNKNTGKQYALEGYDMIKYKTGKTHQVAIMVDDNGKKSRMEQKYLDDYFELVGEE